MLIAAHQSMELKSGDVLGLGRQVEFEVFIPEPVQDEKLLAFKAAGETAVGGRTHNEDAFYADHNVIAVADGVGGRPAGEVAAVLAVEGIKGVRGIADLSRAVRAVNAEVRDRGALDPRANGLASTLDAAVLSAEGGRPWVHGIHVGDGTVLLQRPRRTEVIWLTRAHTLTGELQSAGKDSIVAGGVGHPQGARLMRAVGFTEEVEADEWQEQAEEGQRYLLASDGLIRALGVDGLLRALADLRAVDPYACAKRLVEQALQAQPTTTLRLSWLMLSLRRVKAVADLKIDYHRFEAIISADQDKTYYLDRLFLSDGDDESISRRPYAPCLRHRVGSWWVDNDSDRTEATVRLWVKSGSRKYDVPQQCSFALPDGEVEVLLWDVERYRVGLVIASSDVQQTRPAKVALDPFSQEGGMTLVGLLEAESTFAHYSARSPERERCWLPFTVSTLRAARPRRGR